MCAYILALIQFSDPPVQTMPTPAATPGLGTLMRHLLDLLDGDVQRAYDSLGLHYKPRYTPVVVALLQLGPCHIDQIAQSAGITHSAASQTVGEMVRAGLLTSRPGKDARQRLVKLTAKARRFVPALQAQWEATRAAAESLDAELGQQLVATLERAIAALQRQPFADRIDAARVALGASARPARTPEPDPTTRDSELST
jgi:DNA-binding MarR family transcriptional regulator